MVGLRNSFRIDVLGMERIGKPTLKIQNERAGPLKSSAGGKDQSD